MSTTADCLIELGTEELPPKALTTLSKAFSNEIIRGLSDARLEFKRDKLQSFATPRRLAVIIPGLQTQQADEQIEKLGPAVAAAFDSEGKPSKAAEGFAKSNGVSVNQLEQVESEKGPRLCFRQVAQGQTTDSLLQDIVSQAVSRLPIPKRMRWGASRTEFVRPVHWLLILLDKQTVAANVLGLDAGNTTRGHRFHAPGELQIDSAADYENTLHQSGHVVASFEKRRETIVSQVNTIATSVDGEAVIDDELLDEVTALVEMPAALLGRFDEAFLSVPKEALIYSMSEHQKYFHIVDSDGQLLPYFITVSNIDSTDPSIVVAGNERVIRPRLADAAFFFNTDKKLSLQNLRERLKPVVFQQKLGTVFEKTERIASLASTIADKLGVDKAAAQLAGELCKADLASDMVLEFDKMQGIAGAYYALNDGHTEEVAEAIRSHYLPKFAGDKIPGQGIASAVAIADRLDTLTGIFGIGQQPSGSKDPFALRRAAISILQIIMQNTLSLDLRELVVAATQQHAVIKDTEAVADKVFNYVFDRFAALYQEQGLPTEVFLSVRAIENNDALDFDARIQAVAEFTRQKESESLAAANKRVTNILAKSSTNEHLPPFKSELLAEAAEKELAAALAEKESHCLPLFTAGDYRKGLLQLTELKKPVDAFFDNVMVNTDDSTLKNNRLALLTKLRALFLMVADISLLVPAKK